jgi:hypothetical protein
VKRSKSVKLVLIGSLSAGALAGCNPSASTPTVSTERAYTNNYYVPGVGYYHAPFRGFFGRPYNDYDAANGRYFYGGQWGLMPHQSITNISSPTPEVVAFAESQRSDVSRGGFGRSSHSHHTWS